MQIFLLLLILFLPAQAETILIKRNAGRHSKAILDKNFVFMQSGSEEAFKRTETSSANESRQENSNSSNLNSINTKLNRIETKPTIIVNNKKTTSQTSLPQQNIYDEDNWDNYAEYQTVELDESLDVHASIVNH